MTQVQDLFNAAELALATYANLLRGNTDADDNSGPLSDAGFTSAQRSEFATRYPTVVTSFDDRTGGGSGFQVTVFKDTAGNLTVAFRGTTLPEDLSTGADIVGSGAAYDQIVAMVNWWARASVPAGPGQMAQQFRLAEVPNHLVPAGAVVLRPGANPDTSYVLDAALEVAATGELAAALAANPGLRVDVTGHSLGGHLSMAFSSLFGSRTGQVTVFNAPGFTNSAVNQDFFAKLGGSIPTGSIPTGSIINVAADEALVGDSPFNFLARMHSQPGSLVDIAIEKQTNSDEPAPFSALNHSIVALTDSLAVYKLLADLSPTLSTADYKVILNQAAMFTSASLERIVDALESLFQVNDDLLPSGNNNREREALYQAIYGTPDKIGLVNTAGYMNRRGQLRFAPSATDAPTLLAQAQNATGDRLAYAYALTRLNTFVVFDKNSTGLYARFQAGGQNAGELDLYNPASEQGRNGLTQFYLQDRAAFLERKLYITGLIRNQFYEDPATSDPNDFPNAPDDRGRAYQREAKDFQDRASGFIASDGSPNRNSQLHYIFGSAVADNIVGAAREDHLYGGAGTDFLSAAGADDYLEGGSGRDVYSYAGSSGLLGLSNDGNDTILDTDGKGVLRYSFTQSGIVRSTAITGAALKLSDTQWQSPDGKFTYTKDGADLLVAINGDAGGSLKLRDWRDSDFGIRLWEPRTNPQTTRDIIGDLEPVDPPATDDLGNVVVTSNLALNRADALNDSTGNDHIVSGGGDDTITAFRAGDEWIEAGAGRDWVADAGGNNRVEGGVDTDILYATGTGRDEFYADSKVELAAAITAGEGTGSGLKGDWIMSGAGDDVVAGSAADDVLMGGGGADIIVGGGGSDTIESDRGAVPTVVDWTVTLDFTLNADGTITSESFYDPVVEVDRSAGGADVVYAGAGMDWLYAGPGDDVIDAGSGEDVAWGGDGADVLVGGAGSDVLVGGNLGVSTNVDASADYLDGGAGTDYLYGEAGDDVLIGGPGDDVLRGSFGKDIYVFNKGDGIDTVVDTLFGINHPEAGVLVLGEGFSKGDIKFRLGSLLVDLGPVDPLDPNSARDEVHFEGFDPLDPQITPVLGEIRFADGESMTYADVLAQGFDIDGTEESDDNHDAAHPQLVGTGVTDRIRGLGGNDVLAGLDGDDFLYGDVGSDTLDGGAGNDYLEGGDGFDTLNGGTGDDTYVYDTFDTITDSQGANRIVFGAGIAPENLSVTSFVVSGTPRLLIEQPGATGAGLDLRGTSLTSSSFVYSFADGRTLSQTELLQTAYFVAQTINGTSGNDTLTGFAENDTISGLGGNDTISGGAGDDSLDGGTEDDTLLGGAGNDLLRGLFGNDTLAGGAGSDTLVGFDGADTYVFGYGDGSDTVTDFGNDAGVDSVRLADGISVADVTLMHQPNGDLTVTLNSTQDQLKLPGWYTSGSRVEQVVFGDGTVITEAELAAISVAPISGTAVGDFLTGTPYGDTLQGSAGDDVLDGGRNTFFSAFEDFHGNDLLIGGEGNDTYVLGWRNERDTVIEQPGETSTIRLGPDMTFDDVDATREGDDLFVHGRRTEHGLLLKNYYTQAHDWHIETASGASMTLPAFLALPAPTTGDPVRDLWEARQTEFKHLWYVSAEELLADGTLRDPPTTTVGAHIFQTVDNGEVTRTTIAGVPWGVSQVDTTFGPATIVSSDAASQFSNFANTTGTTTVIDATFDVAWDPTAVSRTTSFLGSFVGFDLLIHSLYRSEVIFSLSGTVEGITLNSTNGASGPDIVNAVTNGGAAPEAVRGTFHSTTDTFSLVEIYGGPSSNAISHRTSGMVDGGAGNDVIDAVGGGFSHTGAGGNFLYGGAGNDGITGSGDADLICGGPGNDTLAGWSSDDTYYFFASDPGVDIVNEATWYLWDYYDGLAGTALFAADSGQVSEDTIEFGPGISLADLTLSWGTHQSRYWTSPSLLKTYETLDIFWDAGNGVRVMMPDRLDPDVRMDMTIHSPGRSWGIEHFKFADGTTHSLQEMIDRIPAQVWNGSAGDDFFEGGAGNNEFFGGTGFDELYGAFGIDVYHYNLGDGQDAIHDPGGTDKVVFGAGIAPEMLSLGVGSLLVRVGSSGDALRIDYFDVNDPFRTGAIETYEFADNTTLTHAELLARGFDLFGTDAPETLTGTSLTDRLYGLDGGDTLNGGAGADLLDGGIGSDSMSGGIGDDTYAVDSAGDAVTEAADAGSDTVRSSLTYALGANLDNLVLIGSGSINGTGNALANSLTGNSGSNLLDGGLGNDVLMGGEGSDSYRFDLGTASETVEETDAQGDDTDTLLFGAGITTANLHGARSGQDLVLTVQAASDQLTLRNWFATLGNRIERTQFADATIWDADTLEALAGTSSNPPLLAAPVADQSATEDAAFSLTVPADAFSDPDAGDTLTYAASHPDGSPLPGWISFDDSTRTFSGIPANGDVGSLDVKMTATDGSGASVSDTFAVLVANTNDAPTVANVFADQIMAEDAVFNFQVPTNTFTDVDVGDTLAYSAALADGSAPPAWLTFDPASRTFSGTPGNGDVGALNVRVTATDTANATASDEFSMEVVNVNDTPNLIAPLADQFGNQNAAISFQVPGIAFMDPDAGDTLTLSAAPTAGGALPAWLSFDSATGSFSGTPSELDVGDVNIRVNATDSASATAAGTFTLSISDDSTVNETHVGTRRRDVIVSGFANDLIDAGRGDDTVQAGAGRDIVFGGRGEDLLYGEAGNDRLYGGKGDDQLDGGLGHDLLYGGRGGDKLEGGEGADLLSGGAGHDLLTGGAGENLLIGGAGRDTIIGGPGGDVFLVNLDDGRDELHLTGAALEGNQDVLSLGGGIGTGDISLKRNQGDLIVEARDANSDERARVILKDWYRDAGDHQTVTTLQLFDGGNAVNYDFKALVGRFDSETEGRDPTRRWSTAHALPAVQLTAGASPLGGDIAREYAMSGTVLGDEPLADEDAEERAALPGRGWDPPLTLSAREDPLSGSKHERDSGRDDRDFSKDKRESLADVLETYLAQNPQYDFEAFLNEPERSERRGEALDAQEIERRWQAVARYANGLANEHDEEAWGGAVYRFHEHGLLGEGAFGGGFGYTGSTGMERGMASLRTLQGLEEGFQRLRG